MAKENCYKVLIDDSKAAPARCGKLLVNWPISKKNKKTFPNEIVPDSDVIESRQEVCEAFNVHFATFWEKHWEKY